MPWMASQIFARPQDEVLGAFRAETALQGHIYLVDKMETNPWPSDECRHGIPAGGLVVVKEIRWWEYEDEDEGDPGQAVPADELARSPDAVPVQNLILPPALFEKADASLKGVLSYLKSLSQKTRSPIAFFFCDMHGGTIVTAYLWVFSNTDRFYAEGEFLNEGCLGEWVDSSKPIRPLFKDVLRSMLLHFDLPLPTPYFALHDSQFPWDKYRL